MSKKRSILIALALCLQVQSGFSQVPGFMGKRFSLGYNFTFFISPYFLTDVGNGRLGFTTRHEFNVNYVLARRVEVYGTFVYGDQNMMMGSASFGNSDSPTSYRFDPTNEKDKVLIRHIGGGIKFYTGRYIAPIGKYFKLQGRYMTYGIPEEGYQGKFTYYKINGIPQTYGLVVNDYLKTNQLSKSAINLSFGFGIQKIFNSKVIMNIYTGTNFFFSEDWPDLGKNVRSSDNDSVDDYIYGTVMQEIRTRYMFDISIGVAYLLF